MPWSSNDSKWLPYSRLNAIIPQNYSEPFSFWLQYYCKNLNRAKSFKYTLYDEKLINGENTSLSEQHNAVENHILWDINNVNKSLIMWNEGLNTLAVLNCLCCVYPVDTVCTSVTYLGMRSVRYRFWMK